jgi:KDO2-lipid IV(A) lauroyltransferase
VEYGAFVAGSALVRALPARYVHRFVAAGARRLFDAGGKRARWTLANLELAFPDKSEAERHHIGRESYAHFAMNAIDTARAQAWSADELRSHVSIAGLEHVHAALAAGNGAFILSLHLGNFELGVQAVALDGLDALIVGRPMRNALLYREIERSRTRHGGELVARKQVAPAILRALRKGRPVFILNDQYSRRSRGVFVPLFGARCSTSAGVATLALRTGAAVVPAFATRDAPDHHRVEFLPALEFEPTGDRVRDIEEVSAASNRALEQLIRRHPEQWMWGHRRFRHSPDVDIVYA